MAYDAGSLKTDVKRKLQNQPRFTDDAVLDGINRGIEKLILWGSEDYDVWTVQNPVDPNDPTLFAVEFTLPPHLLFLASISYDGRPLRKLTQQEWVATRPSRSEERRNPTSYYIRANRFVDLYPRPNKQATVEVYGLFKPEDLVLDTDIPALDRQYSDALVSYACWWCVQGLTAPEEVTRASQFYQMYEHQRAEAKFNLTQNDLHRVMRTH